MLQGPKGSDFSVDRERNRFSATNFPARLYISPQVKLDMLVFKDIKDDMEFCVKLAREKLILFLPWKARLLMEESSAIKFPSISYHLTGTKKVQHELAKPNVIEWFLDNKDDIAKLQECFVGFWRLDDTKAVKNLRHSVRLFGGGVLVFGLRNGGGVPTRCRVDYVSSSAVLFASGGGGRVGMTCGGYPASVKRILDSQGMTCGGYPASVKRILDSQGIDSNT
nr:glutathione synthetase, chloroplastic-like [Tanacetum cinerariifolium]